MAGLSLNHDFAASVDRLGIGKKVVEYVVLDFVEPDKNSELSKDMVADIGIRRTKVPHSSLPQPRLSGS